MFLIGDDFKCLQQPKKKNVCWERFYALVVYHFLEKDFQK
jgi:hypothetical protein